MAADSEPEVGCNRGRVIIHVTTVHPWWDNRIYQKMVLGLRRRGRNVIYIHPAEQTQQSGTPEGAAIALVAGGGMVRRVARNIIAFFKCLAEKGAIVHFHDPEFVPFGIALRFLGHPVIYDVHEDNLLAIPQKGSSHTCIRRILAKLVAGIEWLGARTLTVVIAERAYARRFPQGTPVLNYPEDFGTARAGQYTRRPNARRLLYTGCLSVDRGALHCVDLLLRLPDRELYMVGRCDDDLRKLIEDRAGEARGRLHLMVTNEGLPFSEIKRLYEMGGWEWGLAVFPDTPHYREKELTKFFEYMFYRIPILYSHFPVWCRLISSEYGVAIDPGDLDSAASTLAVTSDAFSRYRSLEQGIREDYTWSRQLDRLNGLYSQLGA